MSKKNGSENMRASGNSLITMKKKSGPERSPCGTPLVTVSVRDLVLSTGTVFSFPSGSQTEPPLNTLLLLCLQLSSRAYSEVFVDCPREICVERHNLRVWVFFK